MNPFTVPTFKVSVTMSFRISFMSFKISVTLSFFRISYIVLGKDQFLRVNLRKIKDFLPMVFTHARSLSSGEYTFLPSLDYVNKLQWS